MSGIRISARINGAAWAGEVEPRLLLSDFLRSEVGLTGTHVGCEHGVCGACTVQLDGEPVRACLMFAVQIDGHEVTTVEALAETPPGEAISVEGLHPIQRALHEAHGLQCGFCTPGILMTAEAFLRENRAPSREEIREAVSGHLCRCTGYHNIVEGVALAAQRLAADGPAADGEGEP
ncbi:(2Fe-2S)-binding protein [Candidatus Palauibacter sp.]|uniref:(2Fe-2S)-binding protein n=1 Tax=Candidatus Palauibacter sp. TaxID=3101350 RepID=UPI003B0232F3